MSVSIERAQMIIQAAREEIEFFQNKNKKEKANMEKIIKPIETEYKGYKFRSRTEARWAVFFDAIGIIWEYEVEGFELSDGTRYLPDFYLPELGIWIEVKGAVTTKDEEKITSFFREEAGNINIPSKIVMVGEIPPDVDDFVDWAYKKYPDHNNYMYGFVDFPYLPCICPTCGKLGFEFEGRGARICHHKDSQGFVDDKGYSSDHPRIRAAYTAARQARFEFGEAPIVKKSTLEIDKDMFRQLFFNLEEIYQFCPSLPSATKEKIEDFLNKFRDIFKGLGD